MIPAIQLQAPRELVRIEIDEPPTPGPGEALVRTHMVGVCGTDISAYLGKFPFLSYPRILGHELGVEVLEVGSGVANVTPGDRCCVEPYINVPDSPASRRGATNCCQQLQVLGVHTDGGLRRQFVLRADKLHSSAALSYEQLALVETLAIGCHATERGAPREGEHTLVIGAGPIGLATIEFTRLCGARITVMDTNPQRLAFCSDRYQVESTIQATGEGSELATMADITGGEFYPLVTDATGSAASMSQALNYLAHTGTLVYVGVTTDAISFPHRLLHLREATIKASRNALPADFRRILALVEQGRIDTAAWITHRTSLDRVADEFDSLTKPESGVLKAMIAVP